MVGKTRSLTYDLEYGMDLCSMKAPYLTPPIVVSQSMGHKPN